MKHWSDLTKEEQATYGNGCGTRGIFSYVPELLFEADCRQHDFYYARGGDIFNKMEADVMFYAHMIKSVNTAKKKWYRKILMVMVATVYFLAVSVFGVFAWNWQN